MSVTLLQPGKVIIPNGIPDHERKRIHEMKAIDYIMEWFTERIPTHMGGSPMISSRGPQDRVLVLRAGTGSGKSVTIGPELYARFIGKGLGSGRSVGITQPRILTATGKPREISEIPSMNFLRFGENLGYQTGLFINKPIKGVIFMTIGVIAHQIRSMEPEDFMRKYSFIVLDECHERSIPLDSAMNNIKQFIHTHWRNELCPFLVLMSATFDVNKYAKYFGVGPDNIIDIMGQSKPIAEKFPMLSCSNLITDVVKTIIEIHERNEHDYKSDYGRDIIVFVSTNGKIGDIIKLIDEYNLTDKNNAILAIRLNSDTFRAQDIGYRNIYKPYANINMKVAGEAVVPMRRVIISTPVAETGVTLPSIKYCIDTGFHMSPEFNPVYNCTVVSEKPITQNMALQRKGRVGRKFPGVWHPLYTKEIFEEFIPDSLPDMVIKSTDVLTLGIMVAQCCGSEGWDNNVIVPYEKLTPFDTTKIDLLDPIPYDSLSLTLQKFYAMGLIDSEYKPTLKAFCSIKMGLSIETSCMILAGYIHGASIINLITIAAFILAGGINLFGRKYKRRQIFVNDESVRQAFKTRLYIGCDYIDYIFIYDEIHSVVANDTSGDHYSQIEQWCNANSVDFNTLKNVFTQRDTIIDSLVRIGLDPYANGVIDPIRDKKYKLDNHIRRDFDSGMLEVKKLKQCLLDGFVFNTAYYSPKLQSYVNRYTSQIINIQSDILPTSGTMPTHILYTDITLSKKPLPGKSFKFESRTISILDPFIDNYDMNYLVS
jgi:HrpA-like RNA helicase